MKSPRRETIDSNTKDIFSGNVPFIRPNRSLILIWYPIEGNTLLCIQI